jgi:hypothetical protein
VIAPKCRTLFCKKAYRGANFFEIRIPAMPNCGEHGLFHNQQNNLFRLEEDRKPAEETHLVEDGLFKALSLEPVEVCLVVKSHNPFQCMWVAICLALPNLGRSLQARVWLVMKMIHSEMRPHAVIQAKAPVKLFSWNKQSVSVNVPTGRTGTFWSCAKLTAVLRWITG